MLSLYTGSYKNLSAGQHLLLQPGLAGFITTASSRLLWEAKETLSVATPTETGVTQTCKPQKGRVYSGSVSLGIGPYKKVALSGTVVVWGKQKETF